MAAIRLFAVGFLVTAFSLAAAARAEPGEMPWIKVSADGRGFVLSGSGKPFVPWGFNYDHDRDGRLLEDYWESEWPAVEKHFAQMKELGANVVRVHLQFGKFMKSAKEPNDEALARLVKLAALAERLGLYLDLTGLGCYHKPDVPAWYDELAEAERWDAQARFWRAVAERVADSPAAFCFDLMNEPIVPGGRRDDGQWLGPPFAGKYFVQFITLDQRDRPRPEIARRWIRHLSPAIRQVDRRHLITVGCVDWSLDRPGITSGFVPEKIAPQLDFLCVHIYPETGKLDEARQTLAGFAVGKPVVVEETFPLKCSADELDGFIGANSQRVAGWISFYWGQPPSELRRSSQLADAILFDWLERFGRRAKAR